MRCWVWVAVVATGCGPAFGDLDFVAVPGVGLTPNDVGAAVETIGFHDCDGDTLTVGVYDGLDLMRPRPLAAPYGTWCGLTVRFVPNALDGSLWIAGTVDATSEPFDLDLDPGDATLRTTFVHDQQDGILVLDLGVLLDAATIEGLDPAEVLPDDALGQQLADGVGDALAFYDTEARASGVYIDLWPDFDFSFQADIDVAGCNGPVWDTGAGGDPDTSGGTDTGTDTDPDTDPDTSTGGDTGGPDGSGCDRDGGGCERGGGGGGGGGGCDGGSSGGGSGPGCSGGGGGGDCDLGCDAGCATVGFAPGWTLILAAVAMRRRRIASRDADVPQPALRRSDPVDREIGHAGRATHD